MFICAFGLYVEVHLGRVAQALEEMEKHLGRHFPDFLTLELGIPHKPWSATEIERHLA